MWTIEKIESFGFKLIQNEKLWCRFRGYEFDLLINLDTKIVKGNYFNFKCIGGNHIGNFKAIINTNEEFKVIINCILNK